MPTFTRSTGRVLGTIEITEHDLFGRVFGWTSVLPTKPGTFRVVERSAKHPLVVERQHTDATGAVGWSPAKADDIPSAVLLELLCRPSEAT